MHHVHESPPVMLVPLYLLAVGAVFAGIVFYEYFIGEGYEAFWKASLFTLPDNHILHDVHGVPLWVKFAPFAAMMLGFLVAYQFYIRSPETPKRLAADHRSSTASCSTSGTSTSSTTSSSSVRPSGSARFLWKTGDGAIIDGLGA